MSQYYTDDQRKPMDMQDPNMPGMPAPVQSSWMDYFKENKWIIIIIIIIIIIVIWWFWFRKHHNTGSSVEGVETTGTKSFGVRKIIGGHGLN